MSRGKINSFKLFALLIGAMLWTLTLSNAALAQGRGVVEAGSTITVRANDPIDVDFTTRETFLGTVAEDVHSRNGRIAIPRGSPVEMVVTETSRNNLVLELKSITVDGRELAVAAGDSVASSGRRQVSTSGRSIYVPADTLVSFRLDRPLRLRGAADDTERYKPGNEEQDSPAYRAGLAAGRYDAQNNRRRDDQGGRYTAAQDRREYAAGYNRGYDEAGGANANAPAAAQIRIGRDNNVTWQAPGAARVYVQVDNQPVQLFGEGATGSQNAPWIERGHLYTFILRDQSGRELARERLDLR
jgi:hypothetical protein